MPSAVAAAAAAALRDKLSVAVGLPSVMVMVSTVLPASPPLVLIVAVGKRVTMVCSVNDESRSLPPAPLSKSIEIPIAYPPETQFEALIVTVIGRRPFVALAPVPNLLVFAKDLLVAAKAAIAPAGRLGDLARNPARSLRQPAIPAWDGSSGRDRLLPGSALPGSFHTESAAGQSRQGRRMQRR